jgi:hypothetical protein
MSWHDELNPGCDLHQVLYRDDGEVLGWVLRLEGDPRSAPTPWRATHCAGWLHTRLSRAVGTEEGELWPFERVTRRSIP